MFDFAQAAGVSEQPAASDAVTLQMSTKASREGFMCLPTSVILAILTACSSPCTYLSCG